jgi:hypothetical protein
VRADVEVGERSVSAAAPAPVSEECLAREKSSLVRQVEASEHADRNQLFDLLDRRKTGRGGSDLLPAPRSVAIQRP